MLLPFEAPTTQCLSDGTNIPPWKVLFGGFGCTSVSGGVLTLAPKAATRREETHSALVVGPTAPVVDSYTYRVTPKTTKQLRTVTAPAPWECGWVIWEYLDNDHFYYFSPKPNGWEFGKRDPAYPGGQRFLSTGNNLKYPIGTSCRVRITKQDGRSTIAVNGVTVTSYNDAERPYSGGRVGVYSEDAVVRCSAAELV